ncbi:unnamed protein product [Absidia cylindrospora]
MRPFIGTPADPDDVCSYEPLVNLFFGDPFWFKYTSKKYRSYQLPGCLPPYRFSDKIVKTFWTAPMMAHARTIWYNVLTKKIPLQPYLALIKPPQDPSCVLCQQHEDLAHFVYNCPFKAPIWDAVLAHQLPLHFLQPTASLCPSQIGLHHLLFSPLRHLVSPLEIQNQTNSLARPSYHSPHQYVI